MGILIRHYLGVEPPQDLEELLDLYAEALFLEDRQIAVMAAAISKAFSNTK